MKQPEIKHLWLQQKGCAHDCQGRSRLVQHGNKQHGWREPCLGVGTTCSGENLRACRQPGNPTGPMHGALSKLQKFAVARGSSCASPFVAQSLLLSFVLYHMVS
eukprot:138055-Amphidinium_carterae.1